MSSQAYVPGPFSLARERNVAHFLDWYLGELARVNLPSQARIVVIGGGAVGCSIAYHLAQARPERDVLVLEKSGLTHGSTWHAAGLVGQLRSKRNLTRLMQYSAQLYGKLEAETGQATEWKPVGSLRLASSEERWSELKRMATTAQKLRLRAAHAVAQGGARQVPADSRPTASSARCSCPTTAMSIRPA